MNKPQQTIELPNSMAGQSFGSAPCSANHRKFLNHLNDSSKAVWTVARMLSCRGYGVTIPATSKAESHSEWKKHADGGDLFISQRVEVKQLGVEFTSAQDWPFGRKFIVCAKHAFDRAQPKPYAFVILSASGSFAAAVFATDRKYWTAEKRRDGRYENITQEFYFCPMETVQFFQMPDQ